MPSLPKPKQPFKVFVASAPKDSELHDEFDKHFSRLKGQKIIETRSNHDITAGTDIVLYIEEQLNWADIILLLFSPDFMTSSQCCDIENKARHYHSLNKIHLRFIYLRPVDLGDDRDILAILLPSNRCAITRWDNRDDAFLSIVGAIRELIKTLVRKQCHEEIEIANQDISGNPDDQAALRRLVSALQKLGELDDDIEAYKQALEVQQKLTELKPDSYISLSKQGSIQELLEKPEDAAFSYEKGLEIKPDDKILLKKNISVQERLGRYDKAVASYDKLLEMREDDYVVWTQRGIALRKLGEFREALKSYRRALQIMPTYRAAKYHQRWTYMLMQRLEGERIVESYSRMNK